MIPMSRLTVKSYPRSAWPMIGASLFLFVVLLGPWVLIALAPLFAVCLLTFHALKALYAEARTKARELPDSGEIPYGFAGHDIRAFTDARGQVWIRAKDVRHLLGLERTDTWMAGAYPDGYCRAHPGVAAWFVRPDVVRRHWGGSTRIIVNRFIHWMDRELVPLQEKRSAIEQAQENIAPPLSAKRTMPLPAFLDPLVDYLKRHWRGEHRIPYVFLSGGILAVLISHLLSDQPAPADLVEHYQRYALLLMMELVAGTVMCAWWGVGVWRMTRRWLGAERSLLVGICFAMGGMTALLYAFDRMADRDQQMTLLALGVIAADLGPKPAISLSADGSRLSLVGEMGFGATRLVRDALKRHPGIKGIELESPGGSAAEGFALARLVRERDLDTYVRSDCASACVLVFASGHERLAAPSARFGLHRSGVEWQRGDREVSPTDREMEQLFRERGVADDFIVKVLQTPFHDLWVPTLAEVMVSRLATGKWLDAAG